MVFETVRYVVADILFGDFSIVPLKGRALFFALGGGHRFLCDDKGIGEHREYFNIECEANLFRGVIGLGHYFQCCCIPCFISC